VITDLCLGARELQIDLAVVVFDILTDEIGDHIHDGCITHHVFVVRADFARVVDPAQRRPLVAVLLAHVETRAPVHGRLTVRRVVSTALLHP